MLLDSLPADDTRALVIDFDHGEIKVETNNDKRKDGKNRKKPQRVVCPYLPVLGLAHDPLGDTHVHGPLSG